VPHVGESGCQATAGPIVDRCVSNAASWCIRTNSVHWIDQMVWTSVTKVKSILSICVKSAKVWDSTADRFIDHRVCNSLLLRHAHTHTRCTSGRDEKERRTKEEEEEKEKQFISFLSNSFSSSLTLLLIFSFLTVFLFFMLLYVISLFLSLSLFADSC
jgi:hypothetical protein